MKTALAVIVASLAVASASYTEQEYRLAFTTWMSENSRSYTNAEFQQRYAVFKSNMDYVQSWNAEGSTTVLGLGPFADLSNEEYRRIYLGTKIDGTARLVRALHTPRAVVGDNYNSTVDWRTKNIVTEIKNQGTCGSCYTFSTTGSVEGAHAQKTGNLVSLSEQNLVDCSTAQGNEGCNGGLMDNCFKYIITNNGIDTEQSYPYEGKAGTCRYDAKNKGATITSFKDVTAGSESDLQVAVAQQPVSVAIDASHISFQLYHSGVYHSSICSTTQLDHGVLAVGYGTDTSSNADYWIVKNSWGNWGMNGYILMSRNKNNNCGIATSASYPIV